MSRRSQKKKSTEPVSVTLQKFTDFLMNFFLSLYIFLILVVLPFYFRDGYSYIATDKAMFFREVSTNLGKFIVLILLFHFALSCAVSFRRNKNGFWKKETFSLFLMDAFIGLYGVTAVLSYFCSSYKNTALWGAEGWYMGLFTQLVLVCAYFLISRLWHPGKVFFYLLYPVSGVVFLLGYLNRFGYYPVQMALSNPSYISTIGNINWYCGYAVTVFFAGLAVFWQRDEWKGWKGALISLYVWLGFATLITQGSASGIVTLGVMLIVMFCLSVKDAVRMQRFWEIALLFSAACLFTMLFRTAAPERMTFQDAYIDMLTTGWLPVVLTFISVGMFIWLYIRRKTGDYPQKIFLILARSLVVTVLCTAVILGIMIAVNTVQPGRIGMLSSQSFFSFSDTWGSNRGVTWKAGIFCFCKQDFLHKMVGVGPDAMSAYLYSDSSQELRDLVNSVFNYQLVLTNAHNEWLTILVNMGILGLIGFGGAIILAITNFLKSGKTQLIAYACGLSILAYSVNNIFSFQQSVNMTTAFILLGMGTAFLRENLKETQS